MANPLPAYPADNPPPNLESKYWARTCFSETLVESVFLKNGVKLQNSVDRVYVKVDPGYGSESSASMFSIASMFFCGHQAVLFDVDHFDATTAIDYESPLLAHIQKIRATPLLSDATIVLVVDPEYGYLGSDIQCFVRRKFDCVLLANYIGRKARIGLTKQTNVEMANITNSYLKARMLDISLPLASSEQKRPILNKLHKSLCEAHFYTVGKELCFRSYGLAYTLMSCLKEGTQFEKAYYPSKQ